MRRENDNSQFLRGFPQFYNHINPALTCSSRVEGAGSVWSSCPAGVPCEGAGLFFTSRGSSSSLPPERTPPGRGEGDTFQRAGEQQQLVVIMNACTFYAQRRNVLTRK